MHCTKMASSGDKSKLKKKSKTLAEKGKNRFLGNDKKGGQGGVGPLGVGLGGGAEPQIKLCVWACDRSVLCGKPGVISCHIGHAARPT